MEITRTFDLLNLYKEKYKMEDALAGKEEGVWVRYSSDQYIDFANNVSYGLLAMGLKKGDKVATISNNRPQWNFVDMGVAQTGIIHVPIYPTISKEEYEYILKDSKPSVIFLSDKALYNKIKPIADKVESVKEVYSFNEVEGAKNWMEVVELGKNGVTIDKILVHDSGTHDPGIHMMLASMAPPEFPSAIGVIRAVKSETFDDNVWASIEYEKDNTSITNVDELLNSGNTWEID